MTNAATQPTAGAPLPSAPAVPSPRPTTTTLHSRSVLPHTHAALSGRIGGPSRGGNHTTHTHTDNHDIFAGACGTIWGGNECTPRASAQRNSSTEASHTATCTYRCSTHWRGCENEAHSARAPHISLPWQHCIPILCDTLWVCGVSSVLARLHVHACGHHGIPYPLYTRTVPMGDARIRAPHPAQHHTHDDSRVAGFNVPHTTPLHTHTEHHNSWRNRSYEHTRAAEMTSR